MSEVLIHWLTDEHECETCGCNYADGANVYIDGRLAIEMTPSAHCYNGKHYSREEVLMETLRWLGNTVTEHNDD